MERILIILCAVVLLQSLLSLGGTLRLVRYCLGRSRPGTNRYQPKAVVIVPCKGLEHDFEENIRPLFNQDYRDYEIIFVTESESDPAHAALSRMIRQSRRAAWLVVAGPAREQGQKVHNLCAAVEMLNTIDRRAEVLVFADSDARTGRQWLSDLVAPLGNKRVGATTGFRWFIAERGSAASLLLSVWNSSALSLLGENSGFAWGGSTAIRRENFDKLAIMRRWQGALSDDYSLTSAIREAGQRIVFVPGALLPSHPAASFGEALEFTTRQMRITRVYSPGHWKLAGIAHALFNLAFWGGAAFLAVSALIGTGANMVLAGLLGSIYALGTATGRLRHATAVRLLAPHSPQVRLGAWAHLLLSPAASLLYLFNLIQSARSRRITWRGIEYEMVSPTQTHLIERSNRRPSGARQPGRPARSRGKSRPPVDSPTIKK